MIMDNLLFQSPIDQCKMGNQKPDTSHRNLSLKNMTFVLAVLGIGFGLAAMVYAGEFVYYKWMKKIENKRNKLAIANKIQNAVLAVLPIEETPTVNDDVITEEKPEPPAGNRTSKERASVVNMTENLKVVVDIKRKSLRL